MAAVLSPTSSPATSPPPSASPSSNPNHPPLHPLITSSQARRSTSQRPQSFAAKNRISQYSNASGPSRSRPPSHMFIAAHLSLPFTIVRDFAYPFMHPLHYGPPPEPSPAPSGLSTPASESQRRLSDPPIPWESREEWAPHATEASMRGEQLAPIQFGDGPPWSEDEDLQSPIVVSSRHKKHKSSTGGLGSGHGRSKVHIDHNSDLLDPNNYEQGRGFYVGSNGDGSERYYVNQGGEANGPGGEVVTYPPHQARLGTLPNRSYAEGELGDDYSESDADSRDSSPSMFRNDESRYSRDYQFTIASPDEEMHGKAVVLFDFERENENELPLVEGQVIWVSYRHGQGWLVAEDPRTHESGLVPEEYVRLVRDIEGGLHSLTGQLDGSPGGGDSGTPTQADHDQSFGHAPSGSNSSNGYQQPVVSTFSTSSKDLHPYPQHLLGTQAGISPPQVVHYHGQRGGSQANTPTAASSEEGALEHHSEHQALQAIDSSTGEKDKEDKVDHADDDEEESEENKK